MPLLQDYNKLFEQTSNIRRAIVNGTVVWPAKLPSTPASEPFYVENISNSTETLSIQKFNSNSPTLTIEYSTDNSNWNTFGTTDFDTPLTMSLNAGDKVYLRCTANVWNNNRINGVSKIGGNIMSLLYGSNFTGKETTFPTNNSYAFERLFQGMNGSNLNLVDASELLLPIDTLTPYCYEGMFCVCENLTVFPELPATTLAEGCYRFLFAYCSSLTAAPELNATVLVDYCYEGLFDSCTSLREIKCLATTNVGYQATGNWTYSVSSTGTFTKAAGVTWLTGVSGIPSGWTVTEV